MKKAPAKGDRPYQRSTKEGNRPVSGDPSHKGRGALSKEFRSGEGAQEAVLESGIVKGPRGGLVPRIKNIVVVHLYF